MVDDNLNVSNLNDKSTGHNRRYSRSKSPISDNNQNRSMNQQHQLQTIQQESMVSQGNNSGTFNIDQLDP